MKKKKMTKGGKAFFTVLGLAIAALIVYIAIIKIPKTEPAVQLTDAQNALTEDFDNDYPATPREVVRAYAQITKCFYEDDTTADQVDRLSVMIRKLFDDQLNANQSLDSFKENLNSEIDTYKKDKRSISSYSVSSSTDVKYSTTSDGEMASLYCTFNVKNGTRIVQDKEQFILRKDKDGHWKILGWRSDSASESDSSGSASAGSAETSETVAATEAAK